MKRADTQHFYSEYQSDFNMNIRYHSVPAAGFSLMLMCTYVGTCCHGLSCPFCIFIYDLISTNLVAITYLFDKGRKYLSEIRTSLSASRSFYIGLRREVLYCFSITKLDLLPQSKINFVQSVFTLGVGCQQAC